MRFRITIVILIFCFFVSCKKSWLDAKTSQDLVVPTTMADMQALMDNANPLNASRPSIAVTASGEFYMTDAQFQGRGESDKNAYTWSNNFVYSSVNTSWGQVYQGLFYCNSVLEGIEKIVPVSQSDKEQRDYIRGQALFQRAYTFYGLSQIWAPAYNNLSADFDLGIPLRLESDVNIPTTRSTVQQTYDQILADLLLSIDLLPPVIKYINRGSKQAAFALLARTYLNMADYEKALKYSNECLLLKNDLVDYNTLNSTLARPIPQPQLNPEMIFFTYMNSPLSLASSFVNPDLTKLFPNDDLRSKIFFKVNADLTSNFKGNYTGASNLFDGIATDEVYLIRAESYARLNKVTEALADLNYLLRKRWKINTFSDLKASNSEDALKFILMERRKELLFRTTRWSDLRRLNMDERFKMSLTQKVSGVNYLLEPNSFKYTFPIPNDILQQTGIKQNKGWD